MIGTIFLLCLYVCSYGNMIKVMFLFYVVQGSVRKHLTLTGTKLHPQSASLTMIELIVDKGNCYK